MGRFDFYPRFSPRDDGFRMPQHGRKEQNDERGGNALAFTPLATPAVADYHSCRSSSKDHLYTQKPRNSLKALTQLSPPTTVVHGRLRSLFGTRLIILRREKNTNR